MAAIPLFWYTNMAAVTSCENWNRVRMTVMHVQLMYGSVRKSFPHLVPLETCSESRVVSSLGDFGHGISTAICLCRRYLK